MYFLLLCFDDISNDHTSFEASYLFLDAIVNHLRFPDTHTRFCMGLILYIYSQCGNGLLVAKNNKNISGNNNSDGKAKSGNEKRMILMVVL